jgi:hypothetical protein
MGWGLAVLAVAAGYVSYGWPGVLMALTVIVFWLLLQFSRAMRVMSQAGGSPVGLVKSVVMLQARLKPGMPMMDVVKLTRSLGERIGEDPEVWRWHDSGGDALQLEFERGRLARWSLERPDPAQAVSPPP